MSENETDPGGNSVTDKTTTVPPQPEPPHVEQDAHTEHGGRRGPDPVRYGDWEKNGRCIDF